MPTTTTNNNNTTTVAAAIVAVSRDCLVPFFGEGAALSPKNGERALRSLRAAMRAACEGAEAPPRVLDPVAGVEPRDRVAAGSPQAFWQGPGGSLTRPAVDSEGCLSPRFHRVFVPGIGVMVGLETGHSRYRALHHPAWTALAVPEWTDQDPPGTWEADPGLPDLLREVFRAWAARRLCR